MYLYGKVRRTDWLPVGGGTEEEQTSRGYASGSSESDEDRDEDLSSRASSVSHEASDSEPPFGCGEGDVEGDVTDVFNAELSGLW